MGNRNPSVRSSFPVLDDDDDCGYRFTADAIELIAAQTLSIGLLLSIDNYYNNKVCKVIKGGGTRCAYLVLRSTVPCRPCRDCHQAPMPLR